MKNSQKRWSGGIAIWCLAAALAALSVAGCSRDPKARYARFMESGKRYAAKKDYARAAIQFSNAAKAQPKDAEAQYQLALAYLGTGDIRRAYAHLQNATKLNPKHHQALLKTAELMVRATDTATVQRAETLAENFLTGDPDNPDVLDLAALAELKLSKPQDAEKHLRQALAKAPAHLRSASMLASHLLAQKDAAGAEAILNKAAAEAPKSADAAWVLGHFYLLMRRFGEAGPQLQKTLLLDPNHSRALVELAALRMSEGKRDEAEQLYRRLSESPDKTYRSAHALYLLRTGRLDPAIQEFRKLAQADPDDRSVRSPLVEALLRAGKADEAEQVLATALKRNPKDFEARFQKAVLALQQRKTDEALAAATEVLRFAPNMARAHLLMARIQRARGEPARARDELGAALRLDPDLLQARLELAGFLIAAGSHTAALDTLNENQRQKNVVAVRFQRSRALMGLARNEEARQELDAVLKVVRSPEVLLQDGVLRFQQKDRAGAEAALEEALTKSPEDARVMEALMMVLRARSPEAALARLSQQVARNPKSSLLQSLLGSHLMAVGRTQEARAAYSAAVALDPKLAPAQLALARLELTDGKLDQARSRLKTVLAASPNYLPALLLMANLEERTGNAAAAAAQLRRVLAADRQNVIALNNLAYLLAGSPQDLDEALTYAQRAAELAPNAPPVLDTLGWIYYQKGLYGPAVKYLQSAVSGKDNTAQRQYHLALAYLRLGEKQRGQQALEAALKMDPNRPEAQMARKVLMEMTR